MPQYQDYFGQAALRPEADIPRSLDQLYDLYLKRKGQQRQEGADIINQGFKTEDVGDISTNPNHPMRMAFDEFMAKRKAGEASKTEAATAELLKTRAETGKLDADAEAKKTGFGDFYSEEQAAAILRDPIAAKTLSGSFGGRIPKGAISPAAAVGGREATLSKPAVSDFSARGFADKAKQAHQVLEGLVSRGFDPASIGNAAAGWLPNMLKPEEVQSSEQGLRQFVNAILRRESGAAIPDGELVNYRKQYWPQGGDSRTVLEQKRAARDLAIRGLESEAHKVPTELGKGQTQSNESIVPVVGPDGKERNAVVVDGKFVRFQ